MFFSELKSVPVPDSQFTVVEPTTGVHRSCTASIISLPKIGDDTIDVALYKTAIVLSCLHKDGKPVLPDFLKQEFNLECASLPDCYKHMQDAAEVYNRFADMCPNSFMQRAFDIIDKDIVMYTSKAQDAVKNA